MIKKQLLIDFPIRKSPRVKASKEEVVTMSPLTQDKLEKQIERLKLQTPKDRKLPQESCTDSPKRRSRVAKDLFGYQNEPDENKEVSPRKIRRETTTDVLPDDGKYRSRVEKRPVESNPVEEAKYWLNSSCPVDILYRENECQQIKEFLLDHLNRGAAGSLYVSGAPGTGKTLCVTHIMNQLQDTMRFKHLMVNCMGCRTPSSVFSRISKELGLEAKNGKISREMIEENIVTPTKSGRKNKKLAPMTIIVLDEIDELQNKSQDVLYTLFEWPQMSGSRLILVGIANTLDFATRSLNRLEKMSMGCVTEISFQPYTKDQVKGIIACRLPKSDADNPIFKESALELCARKVASVSGDIRKALHVCRRALELAQTTARPDILLKVTSDDGLNPGSPRIKQSEAYGSVTVTHVSQVLKDVYGSKAQEVSSSNGNHSLPATQQILLSSLLLFSKFSKKKEVEVTKCHQIFVRICTKKSIAVENSSEFLSMCQLLESKGLLTLKTVKDVKKISLSVDEDEINRIMTDKNLFKSILSDSSLIV